VRILHLGTLAEDCVALVEKQDAVAAPGLLEDGPEVLFRLADILAYHLRNLDLVKLHMELVCHHLGGHCLAGAGRAGKEHGQAPAIRHPSAEAPLVVYLHAVADMVAGMLHEPYLVLRQNQTSQP